MLCICVYIYIYGGFFALEITELLGLNHTAFTKEVLAVPWQELEVLPIIVLSAYFTVLIV